MRSVTSFRRRAQEVADTETPEDALTRIRSGSSKNDRIVVLAFIAVGIPIDDISPRVNVLTFHAWKAAGRKIAKGAISQGVQTWIPIDSKKDREQDEQDEPRGKTRRRIRPRTAHVFHITQTLPASAPKGTRPAAWQNESLIRPGTYDPTPAPELALA